MVKFVTLALWPVLGLIVQLTMLAHKVQLPILPLDANVVTDAQQRLLMSVNTHKHLDTTPLPSVRPQFSAQQVSTAPRVRLDQDLALLDSIVRPVLRTTETLHALPVSTVKASS